MRISRAAFAESSKPSDAGITRTHPIGGQRADERAGVIVRRHDRDRTRRPERVPDASWPSRAADRRRIAKPNAAAAIAAVRSREVPGDAGGSSTLSSRMDASFFRRTAGSHFEVSASMFPSSNYRRKDRTDPQRFRLQRVVSAENLADVLDVRGPGRSRAHAQTAIARPFGGHYGGTRLDSLARRYMQALVGIRRREQRAPCRHRRTRASRPCLWRRSRAHFSRPQDSPRGAPAPRLRSRRCGSTRCRGERWSDRSWRRPGGDRSPRATLTVAGHFGPASTLRGTRAPMLVARAPILPCGEYKAAIRFA